MAVENYYIFGGDSYRTTSQLQNIKNLSGDGTRSVHRGVKCITSILRCTLHEKCKISKGRKMGWKY